MIAGVVLAHAAVALPPVVWHGPHGKTARGYLGANFRDISDDQIATLKLKDAHGAEIFVLDHDGPACKAGLREHDVVLQMNGQVIQGEEELRRLLHESPAGRSLTFVISRDGQQQTVTTQLANREEVEQRAWEQHMKSPEPSWRGSHFLGVGGGTPDVPKTGLLGSTILNASYTGAVLELMGPQLADYFGAHGGLLVRAVEPGSPAAIAGMRAGDVVLRVNFTEIKEADDWTKIIRDNKNHSVSVTVLRDRKEQTLTMEPDTKKRSSLKKHIAPEGAELSMESSESAFAFATAL